MRAIAPLDLGALTPKPPGSTRPELTWINPREILVDDGYQRNIGERGRKLIRSILENFDWRLWRPPVCAWTDAGLEAIDGQHSLVAAASHPGISEVPVMIVEACARQDRSELFVGANRDRLAVTRLQMHAAAVLACDPSALVIEKICLRLGVTILKATPFQGNYKPRETLAVAAIAALIKHHDESMAERMIAVVAETNAAPISVNHLKAAELLLTDPEFVHEIEPAEITSAALSIEGMGEQEAKLFAATHRVPQWRALASIWFRAAKKTPRKRTVGQTQDNGERPSSVPASPACVMPSARPAPSIVAGSSIHGISRTSTGGRLIDRRPASSIVNLGDMPGPGRSALDQRRSAGL